MANETPELFKSWQAQAKLSDPGLAGMTYEQWVASRNGGSLPAGMTMGDPNSVAYNPNAYTQATANTQARATLAGSPSVSLTGLQNAVSPAAQAQTQSLTPAVAPAVGQPSRNVDPTSNTQNIRSSTTMAEPAAQTAQAPQAPQHPYMAPSLSPRMRRRQGRGGRGGQQSLQTPSNSLAGLQSAVE